MPAGGRLAEYRRGANRWHWAGVLGGVVTAVAVAESGGFGRGFLLAAPLFALCLCGGILLGELTVAAPTDPTRRATLVVRRTRDYLPRRLTTAVLVTTAALLSLAAVTTAAGSADDLGRAGRMLSRRCGPAAWESAGPWPGSYYSVPLVITVLIGLGTAGLTLRWITRRPRLDSSPELDDALRRRAGRRVVAAAGILTTIPLAGIALVAGGALLGTSCRPPWWSVAGWLLLGLIPVLLAMLGWCAAVVLAPERVATAPAAPAATRREAR